MKIALSCLAIAIGMYGYWIYLRDIYRRRTKPHMFSWLIWAALTVIAFAAQITNGGGAGAWITALAVVFCTTTFISSLFIGETHGTRTDWICLSGAALAALLWAITNHALVAVVIVSIIDTIGFIPTLRKSYDRPWDETCMSYVWTAVKFGLSIAALSRYSATTILYFASTLIMNVALSAELVMRRRAVPRPASHRTSHTTVHPTEVGSG